MENKVINLTTVGFKPVLTIMLCLTPSLDPDTFGYDHQGFYHSSSPCNAGASFRGMIKFGQYTAYTNEIPSSITDRDNVALRQIDYSSVSPIFFLSSKAPSKAPFRREYPQRLETVYPPAILTKNAPTK